MSSQFNRTPRFAFPSSSSVPYPSSAVPFTRRRVYAEDVAGVDDDVLSDAPSVDDNPVLEKEEQKQEDPDPSSPLLNVVSGRVRRNDDGEKLKGFVARSKGHGASLGRFVQTPALQEDIESSPIGGPLFIKMEEQEEDMDDMHEDMDGLVTQNSEQGPCPENKKDDNNHSADDSPSIMILTPRPKRRRQDADDSPSLPNHEHDRGVYTAEEENRYYEPYDDLTANASSPITSPIMSAMEPPSTISRVPISNTPTLPSFMPPSTATTAKTSRRHFIYQTSRPSDDRYQAKQRMAPETSFPPDFSPHRNKRSGKGAQRFITHGLAAEVRDWIIQSSTPTLMPGPTARAGAASSSLFAGTSKRLFAPSSTAATGSVSRGYVDRVRVIQTHKAPSTSSITPNPDGAATTGPATANQGFTQPLTLVRAIPLTLDIEASADILPTPSSPGHQHISRPENHKDRGTMNILLLGRGHSSAPPHSRAGAVTGNAFSDGTMKGIRPGDVLVMKPPSWTVLLPTSTAGTEQEDDEEKAEPRQDHEERGGEGTVTGQEKLHGTRKGEANKIEERKKEEWRVILNWSILCLA